MRRMGGVKAAERWKRYWMVEKKGEEESGWPEKKINSDVEKTNS